MTRRRPLSNGELTAYQLGLELGRSRRHRVERIRRIAYIDDSGVLRLEEEIIIDEYEEGR